LKLSSSENLGTGAAPEVGYVGDCTGDAASNISVWLPTLERLRERLPPDRTD
jgi:hypothetical protein